MNNKLMKTVVVGLVVVLVMSLGAAAVFAQDGTPSDDTTPGTEAQPALPFGRGGFGGPRGHHGSHGADEEALAAELGITVEELQAAREEIMAERLAQAVVEGYLTQEQVDVMEAMHAVKEVVDREAIMAQVLGLTVDELAAAKEDGSLRDILADITPADLQARLQEATETAVAGAVATGDITQAQADLFLEQAENGLGVRGNFGGLRGFEGRHQGFGGRGGSRGAPQGDQTGAAFAPFGAFQSSGA